MEITIKINQEVSKSDKVWLIGIAIDKINDAIRQGLVDEYILQEGSLELEGKIVGTWIV